MNQRDRLTVKTARINRDANCADCGANMPRGQRVMFVSGIMDDEYYSARYHFDCAPDVFSGVTIVNKD